MGKPHAVSPTSQPRVAAAATLITAVVCVGLAAWMSAASVDDACHHAGPPVMHPVAGTPRAGYCDALDGIGLMAGLILVPTVLAAAAAFALRSRPRAAFAIAVLTMALAVGNAVFANSLEHSVTV